MFAAAVPVSRSVRRAIREHRDLGVLLTSVDEAATARPSRRIWGEPARVPGVTRWCFRFTDRSCVGQSLTTFALLRRQGESPCFISGVVSRGGGDATTRLDGHAWVELDGRPLGETDRAAPTTYAEIFRYPAET